jgi:hypothetical protein
MREERGVLHPHWQALVEKALPADQPRSVQVSVHAAAVTWAEAEPPSQKQFSSCGKTSALPLVKPEVVHRSVQAAAGSPPLLLGPQARGAAAKRLARESVERIRFMVFSWVGLEPVGTQGVTPVHVALQKYGSHLPLTRQERTYQREGLAMDTQTLWSIGGMGAL